MNYNIVRGFVIFYEYLLSEALKCSCPTHRGRSGFHIRRFSGVGVINEEGALNLGESIRGIKNTFPNKLIRNNLKPRETPAIYSSLISRGFQPFRPHEIQSTLQIIV